MDFLDRIFSLLLLDLGCLAFEVVHLPGRRLVFVVKAAGTVPALAEVGMLGFGWGC